MPLTSVVFGTDDEGRWLSLLTPEGAGLADAAAFATWRRQLVSFVKLGLLDVYATVDDAAGPARAVLVVQPSGGHCNLVVGAGDLDDAALGALVDAVTARSAAVTFTAEVGPDWAARLAPRGFAAFEHQSFVLHLPRVAALREPAVADPALIAWDDLYRAEVSAMAAQACEQTLAGLMLTLPSAPSRAALAAHIDAFAAPGGALLSDATSLHLTDGRVTGVLLMVKGPAGPLLQVLVVDPAVRAEGVARRLLRRSQRTLLAAGETQFHFWTTDDNTPVHRLYQPAELDLLSTQRCGYWLRAGTH